MCDPLHIVLTRHDSDGTITLVSSHSLEWRDVLTGADGATKSIELMGIGE